MACGLWLVACGLWLVACGLWLVACGIIANLSKKLCHFHNGCASIFLVKNNLLIGLNITNVLEFQDIYANVILKDTSAGQAVS